MSVPYIQPWIDVVTFLTKDLEMSLFSKDNNYETYRAQIKDHIVTVIIKIDDYEEGPEIRTELNINGANIWWHKFEYHSGYTVTSIEDFNNVEFVRIISRNSRWFADKWVDYADL